MKKAIEVVLVAYNADATEGNVLIVEVLFVKTLKQNKRDLFEAVREKIDLDNEMFNSTLEALKGKNILVIEEGGTAEFVKLDPKFHMDLLGKVGIKEAESLVENLETLMKDIEENYKEYWRTIRYGAGKIAEEVVDELKDVTKTAEEEVKKAWEKRDELKESAKNLGREGMKRAGNFFSDLGGKLKKRK